MSNFSVPFLTEVYMGPQYEYGPPPTLFKTERARIVRELAMLISHMNESRADLEEIVRNLEYISGEIITILLPRSRSEEIHFEDVSGCEPPKCFEERCTMISRQIKEYAVEMTESPNIAYAISYGLLGIAYLIGSLRVCGCNHCDPYAANMDLHVKEFNDHMPYEPDFMPQTAKKMIAQVETNFFVLRKCPEPSTCDNSQCYLRIRI